MKKFTLILLGLAAAAVILYLSRSGVPGPTDQQVAGAIGAKQFTRGATVCVQHLQDYSEKRLASFEGIDDLLVAQLNQAGYKSRLLAGGGSQDAPEAKSECDATVYGEIIGVKGKNRKETEVEFRLVLAGDEKPVLSAIAKGKSSESTTDPAASGMVMAFTPAKVKLQPGDQPSNSVEEALSVTFAEIARQIQQPRPLHSGR